HWLPSASRSRARKREPIRTDHATTETRETRVVLAQARPIPTPTDGVGRRHGGTQSSEPGCDHGKKNFAPARRDLTDVPLEARFRALAGCGKTRSVLEQSAPCPCACPFPCPITRAGRARLSSASRPHEARDLA